MQYKRWETRWLKYTYVLQDDSTLNNDNTIIIMTMLDNND